MTGNRGLFDSNIIIYLSKRELPLSIVDQFDEIFISVITYMEILGYGFEDPNEEIFIKDLLSVFKTIYIDQRIADIVVKIRKIKRIKLPDAIISATAISEGLFLVTRNIEDFKDIDIKLTNPFEMNYPAAELRGIKMNFYLINPDAEHRGILLIKTLRAISSEQFQLLNHST